MTDILRLEDSNNSLSYRFSLARKSGKNSSLKKGNQMINSNDRLHYIVRGQLTDYLRKLAYSTATRQTPAFSPTSPLYTEKSPCGVLITVYPPTRRRFDPPNIYPTVKALIDGLTDAGVWEDDNNKIIKLMGFNLGGLSTTKNYIVQVTIFKV